MEEVRAKVVGVDCGEEKHVAVLLSADGQLERRVAMSNRRDTIQECMAQLMLQVGRGTKLVVVVESRRSYGRLVADVAEELGCEVWQVNTVALNHYRAVEGQPRKSDEWDAYLAARMVHGRSRESRGCRPVPKVSAEERALSRLTRTHRRLKGDQTRRDAQLRAVLLELAPEVLHSSWEGPKLGSKAMAYLLERWPGFEGLEKAQLRSIEAILHRCRYGGRARPVARVLRDMARRISIAGQERAAITVEISLLMQEIVACDAALERLDEGIASQVMKQRVGVKLLAVPGIGPVTAGVLVSELLPVARTATEAESAAYAGITPLGRKSGKSLDTARLAQGVNKRILHALYASGVSAVKHSAINRAYYTKKLRDYAGHPKPTVAAYLALARQRHKVVYKLMTTQARYDNETLVARHLTRLEAERSAVA